MRAQLGKLRRLSTAVRSSLRRLLPSPPPPLPSPSPFRTRPIASDLSRGSSLGFYRGFSRFATGFTPLHPEPLESILDMDRAKNLSSEDLVSAWDDMPHIVFTGLEDYKARGTQASPYFTIKYYTEFIEMKNTVLIRGDVVFTSKLSDDEAKWLLEASQSFYLNDSRFNREAREFEFRDVLKALGMPDF